MPSLRRPALFVSLGGCLAWFAMASATFGQQVWSGYTYTFDHPANSTIQDDITPNVSLTRDALRGIYNIAYEVAYEDDYSPEYTLWATEYNNLRAEQLKLRTGKHWNLRTDAALWRTEQSLDQYRRRQRRGVFAAR